MISRIKQLLDWQQLSPTQFADRIGVGRPVVSHILSERNKPSLEVVQRIIAAFPGLSLPWLLSGTGEMLANIPASGAPESLGAAVAPATPPPAASEKLPAAAPVATLPAPGSKLAQPIVPPTEQPAPAYYGATPAVPARFAAAQAKAPVALPPAVAEIPARRFVVRGMEGTPTVASLVAPAPLPAAEAAVGTAPLAAAASPLPVPSMAPTAEVMPAAPPAGAAELAGILGETSKAVRCIVIFYSDGSFADYKPEN